MWQRKTVMLFIPTYERLFLKLVFELTNKTK